MSVSQSLADFVCRTEYGDVPREVVRKAKYAVRDFIGVTLAGSVEPISEVLRTLLQQELAKPESTVLGLGIKTTCRNAALANGTLGHVLDYDDQDSQTIGHPSATLLPSILAIGERERRNGKELLAAYVVGLEVECKIGLAMNPRHYRCGWHSTGTLGAFGAVAAAAKMLNLKKEEVVSAFGIVGSLASGLRQNFGTMMNAFHAGRAAENGVLAALLAKEGFTSSNQILEGEWGFFKVLEGGNKDRLRSLPQRLGRPFTLLHPGLDFKKYPSCGCTHAAMDAIISIATEQNLKESDIAEVLCRTVPLAHDTLVYRDPKTYLEAKFSLDFCLALAFQKGEAYLADFTMHQVEDPQIRSLMEEVRVRYDKKLEKCYGVSLGAVVSVKTKDGRKFKKRVEFPKGSSKNRLTDDEFKTKFKDCAGRRLPSDRIEHLERLLSDLENLNDISLLINETA